MKEIINDILNDRIKEKNGNENDDDKIQLEDNKALENEKGCFC